MDSTDHQNMFFGDFYLYQKLFIYSNYGDHYISD
jgi:hypothetical protein